MICRQRGTKLSNCSFMAIIDSQCDRYYGNQFDLEKALRMFNVTDSIFGKVLAVSFLLITFVVLSRKDDLKCQKNPSKRKP